MPQPVPFLQKYYEGTSPEQRGARRDDTKINARLAYGGLNPGLVGCEVLDVSETGLRVSTFGILDPCPEFFSIEFNGTYSRARRAWAEGRLIGLEFIIDEGGDPLSL